MFLNVPFGIFHPPSLILWYILSLKLNNKFYILYYDQVDKQFLGCTNINVWLRLFAFPPVFSVYFSTFVLCFFLFGYESWCLKMKKNRETCQWIVYCMFNSNKFFFLFLFSFFFYFFLGCVCLTIVCFLFYILYSISNIYNFQELKPIIVHPWRCVCVWHTRDSKRMKLNSWAWQKNSHLSLSLSLSMLDSF